MWHFVIILTISLYLILPACAEMYLHVPEKMIAGATYEGMISLDEPAMISSRIILASGSSEIIIPKHVTIHAGDGSAIFKINPENIKDDTITFHAISENFNAETISHIYSIAEKATSLELTAPGSLTQHNSTSQLSGSTSQLYGTTSNDSAHITRTSLDVMPMRVTLTDSHGLPITSDTDIPITLSSSADMGFNSATYHDTFSKQHDIIIPAGEYGAGFFTNINSNGVIYATSENLRSGMLEVEYVGNDITVMLGIPPLAARDSYGHVIIWLEKSGMIYSPDDTNDVILSSSDYDAVRFGISDHIPIHVGMTGGYAVYGVYFGNPTDPENPPTITAQINGIGVGSTTVSVVDVAKNGHTIHTQNNTNETKPYPKTCMWMYPTIPADMGWITIMSFSDLTSDNSCPTNPNDYTTSDENNHPILLDETEDMVTIESDDMISFENRLNTNQQDFTYYTYSATFPFSISGMKQHTISATHIGKTAQHTFYPAEKYSSDRILLISSIPANIGTYTDVAFLYIANKNGIITDNSTAQDKENIILSQLGDGIISPKVDRNWVGGVSIISGIYDKEHSTIHAVMSGANSSPTYLEARGLGDMVEIWMPSRVNTGSEFPIIAHYLDSAGIPIKKVPWESILFSEGIYVRNMDDVFRAKFLKDQVGIVRIIADGKYVSSIPFESFSYEPGENILAWSISPDVIRLGEDILLDITTANMINPNTFIHGKLDFTQNNTGIYTATPNKPGPYQVDVQISKDGWTSYQKTIKWNVEHRIDVILEIITDDNVSIPVMFSIESSGGDMSSLYHGDSVGLLAGVYKISIPTIHHVGTDREYILENIKINGNDISLSDSFTHNLGEDTEFVLTYNRKIEVSFEAYSESTPTTGNITGNGYYSYGSVVNLVANPTHEAYGLVWNMPVEWIDLPPNATYSQSMASFVAHDSISGYVKYERSYVVAIAVFAAFAIIPILIARSRSPDAFLNLADVMRKIIRYIKMILAKFTGIFQKRTNTRRKGDI